MSIILLTLEMKNVLHITCLSSMYIASIKVAIINSANRINRYKNTPLILLLYTTIKEIKNSEFLTFFI